MSTGGLAAWFDRALANDWDSRLRKAGLPSNIERAVEAQLVDKSYSERLDLFALAFDAVPGDYESKCRVIGSVLGPENSQQFGMFSKFYWLLPVSRYIQKFGADHPDESLALIAEITKRSTGEYAIRPLAERYPDAILAQCHVWAKSDSFHLRRLASEGLRPNLPWAPKLTVFLPDISQPLELLDTLVSDQTLYVRKSVANHASDYLRTHPDEVTEYVNSWRQLDSPHAADVVKRFDKRASKRRPAPN